MLSKSGESSLGALFRYSVVPILFWKLPAEGAKVHNHCSFQVRSLRTTEQPSHVSSLVVVARWGPVGFLGFHWISYLLPSFAIGAICSEVLAIRSKQMKSAEIPTSRYPFAAL